MSADGGIVSEIEQKLEVAIRKHIRPIKTQGNGKSMSVIFGERAFSCSVDSFEFDALPGHALELAKAVHVLQRVMTRFDEWSDEGEFWEGYRARANVGLDFLSGMVAQMMEVSEGTRTG